MSDPLRDALVELRDRIKMHPAYADLTEEEEMDIGGDTAELSYLARIADDALAAPKQEPVLWGLRKPSGEIDADLCGSKADCEYWSRAEDEPWSGCEVVPLYATPPAAHDRTEALAREYMTGYSDGKKWAQENDA